MFRIALKSIAGCALLGMPVVAGAVEWTDMGHVHDLAVAGDGSVYLATHAGIFRVSDGKPAYVADGHFTSLALSDQTLTLAGFDAEGEPGSPVRLVPHGNDGMQRRTESGDRQFLAVASDGDTGLYAVAEEALFHRGDPQGEWERRGRLPNKVIDLAAGGRDGVVYAATGAGLMISEDRGQSWTSAALFDTPATAVTVQDGAVFVFQYKLGLMRSPADELSWDVLSNDFGPQVPVRMGGAGDGRLYASTNHGYLFMSADSGENWRRVDRVFPGRTLTAAERRGEAVYEEHCVSCHGVDGVGEAPRLGEREEGLAPALDETMHAWHHTDANLKTVIRDGTGGRMPGWGDTLSQAQIDDLLAYMKGLWDDLALRCQGPAHMNPDCRRN